MSDYKDIIAGTLKNLAGKVKEVAESDTVRGIYQQSAGKAKVYGSIAKMTLEINGTSEELKRVYTEIGKLYFEQAKAAPEGFFAPLFAQAEQLQAEIDAKQIEIDALKAELKTDADGDDDISVEITEFEEIVAETEADGVGADTADAADEENQP